MVSGHNLLSLSPVRITAAKNIGIEMGDSPIALSMEPGKNLAVSNFSINDKKNCWNVKCQLYSIGKMYMIEVDI